jgi:hypothetical protein
MEMDLKARQEGLSCLDEPVEIVPPAVAGQFLFHIAPETLDQVELRGVDRQPEGVEAVGKRLPSRTQFVALVVAGIVKHQDHGFAGRQRLGQLLEKGNERCLAFLLTAGRDNLPTGVVKGTEDNELLVRSGCRHLHGFTFLAPDFRQVRMGDTYS